MDDILKILLGSILSLLGSVVVLFFQLRQSKREFKRNYLLKRYEETFIYLYDVARLHKYIFVSVLSDLRQSGHSTEDFTLGITPILDNLTVSPINNIPLVTFLQDKEISNQINDLKKHVEIMRLAIEFINNRVKTLKASKDELFKYMDSADLLISEIEENLLNNFDSIFN